MNKKLLVVLAGIATLSLSACDNKGSNKSTPSGNSSSSSSSSSTYVPLPSLYTDEELQEGQAYLEENHKSICKVNPMSDAWTQYCTEGQKEIVINHAQYNKKTNVGDIAIMQHTSAQIAMAEAVSSNDNYPSEEENPVYRDWQANHCSLTAWGSSEICTSKYIDEGNNWNWRIMVDSDGKIAAMHPSGVGYATPIEPYFSNPAYTHSNNNDMYFIYTREFGTTISDENPGFDEKHVQAWTIAEPGQGKQTSSGFNILEHSNHHDGRHANYKFIDGGEQDLLTWAFMGSLQDTIADDHFDWSYKLNKKDFLFDGSENPEDVYALMNVGYAFEIARFYIPGQFDDVRFEYERLRDNDGRYTTEAKLTEKFEYDPYGIYLKFKAYHEYLDGVYDEAYGQTSADADALYEEMPTYEEKVLELLHGLNCDKIRNGSDEEQMEATALVENALNVYKTKLLQLKTFLG